MQTVQAGLAVALGLALATDAVAAPPASDLVVTHYPAGGQDDLLTAGLGALGLQGTASAVTDPGDPAPLRRLAIYNNYRGLVDTSTGGGYGSLYGPTVDAPPEAGPGGQIYGREYLTYDRRSPGRDVTMMVQIPEFFGQGGRPPCIVTGPSSGSRGVYGAIGTSGEWGLKQGCAVAYTDKGAGIGAHDLQAGTVTTLQGVRESVDVAGRDSNFTAKVPGPQLARFLEDRPNRWAWKHAHSRVNPEGDWDEFVLELIEFAFAALNDLLGGKGKAAYGPANTLVIASSVSNGGAASLRAAEKAKGVIDAVVVSEPNVNPRYDPRFGIQQGGGPVLYRHSRPLYDYLTLVVLYQGCANLANLGAPFFPVAVPAAGQAERCQSLHEAGLLSEPDTAAWPQEAQDRINAYGLLPEQNVVAPSYWGFYVAQAVAATYANAYSRASVTEGLCGYSFVASSLAAPDPAPLPVATAALLFATGNGIPPTGGVGVSNDLAPEGPRYDPVSTSPTFTRADQNLDGAICLRSLWLGRPEAELGRKAPLPWRIRTGLGVAEILADGRLHGTPTIILHGRSDALIAPNHSSRAYYGLNRLQEGAGAPTRYYEVTNAQHLDGFNALPGYSTRFVPLHHYFVQALDLMWAHLTEGAALPPSQVVATTPRSDPAATITATNVPAIAGTPGPKAIGFSGSVLRIPD